MTSAVKTEMPRAGSSFLPFLDYNKLPADGGEAGGAGHYGVQGAEHVSARAARGAAA